MSVEIKQNSDEAKFTFKTLSKQLKSNKDPFTQKKNVRNR